MLRGWRSEASSLSAIERTFANWWRCGPFLDGGELSRRNGQY
jgi:hypothetical protein